MPSLIPPQLPLRWDYTAEEILSETEKVIKECNEMDDKIGAIPIDKISIESVLKPYSDAENVHMTPIEHLSFFQHVSSSKEIRDASNQAQEKFDETAIDSGLKEEVYKVFNHLFKQYENSDKLDSETKRFLEKVNKEYERNGLALSLDKRDKIKQLQKKLANLKLKFSKNLGEETEFLLFTKEELEGVPESVLNQFTVVQNENGIKKLKMTYKYPDFFPVLKYCKNANTRKLTFLGSQNKVPENADILTEAIKIRADLAKLLGYENYSEYVLEMRMAKNSTTVLNFLNDLKTKLKPLGLKEKERILTLKKEDLKIRNLPQDNTFPGWDQRFYDNMLLEKEYQIDAEKISEYFPMESTVSKMLQIFEKLFNLKFQEIENDSKFKSTWHEDVKQFSVWKLDDPSSPEFVGWLYFDLFPREGKYGHAANFGLSPSYTKPDGSKAYPVTALVCNFSKPTKEKPSLLKHDEVTTFFHELGHGIHDLLGRAKYARFHGTAGSLDFVECPSQMLEYWTWSKEGLTELSAHYLNPEKKLPEDLINSLIRTKHVNGALFNLRQLHFALFDMALHVSKTGELDICSLWNDSREEIALVDNLGEVTKGYASFGHLLGGYESGYYGYLWSQVFAADIFYSKFKKDPMSNVNGLQYRDIILARGATRDEMDNLVELLGRKPKSDAFLEELGVN
ncbi:hypothetical protein PACTADRAFT_36577 [Pachysolen tannophilus NRRL Y-2460]|uniref:Peptidase M3A/M3B catalytic domain-containing protein n=1 Tax=Pachysolen tannophilus NRRL Y-2460 TaxID=669874 RepID=A0A1E4U1V6_PACTA|nr:hypothetical protein PACTADRAFT_36577 [Pachysolen tannophilus NRRL Y-2460]